MNSRLSKLNRDTVGRMIRSNPYHKAKLEESDLLVFAVKLALIHIQKLGECCSRLGADAVRGVEHLKRQTEELLHHIDPLDKEVKEELSNLSTKPWANNRPPTSKGTSRR